MCIYVENFRAGEMGRQCGSTLQNLQKGYQNGLDSSWHFGCINFRVFRVFNKVGRSRVPGSWGCLWWGRKSLSHSRGGYYKRGLERISRQGWCGGGECHPAQKNINAGGDERVRQLPTPIERLPSCSLKAPMRIPRPCFALF